MYSEIVLEVLLMIMKIISIIAGASAGWLYYRMIGCSSGACPITSNPLSSILFGGVFGYLLLPELFDLFRKKGKKNDQSE